MNTKRVLIFISFLALTACIGPDLTGAQQLGQGLSQSAVQLQQSGGQLKIVALTDNAFQGKSSHLTPQMTYTLAEVTHTLKTYPDLRVKVTGYTDNRGNPKRNQLVSLRRAMMVADYFRNHGIDSARIATAGKGQEYPIADNASAQGRAQNRRIEIQLF